MCLTSGLAGGCQRTDSCDTESGRLACLLLAGFSGVFYGDHKLTTKGVLLGSFQRLFNPPRARLTTRIRGNRHDVHQVHGLVQTDEQVYLPRLTDHLKVLNSAFTHLQHFLRCNVLLL